MCLLCFYCFSELLEADLGDFEVMSRTRENQFSLVRDISRSINIIAWPVYQRWKVSDEDQRRRRNNWLRWRKGKSLALKICITFDKSAVKNSL